MRPAGCLALLPGLLVGCEDYVPADEEEPLALQVTAPLYGAFVGDGPVVVEGRVRPPGAALTVEGGRLEPDVQGHFRTEVALDGPWRMLEVEAARDEASIRERIPVFRGHDPAETWPGGIPMRVLPAGLEILGGPIGPFIDTTGWGERLAASLPTVDLGWLVLVPTDLTHAATGSALGPAPDGLALDILLRDVTLYYDAIVDVAGVPITVPISMAYGTITLTALAVPSLDAVGRVFLVIQDPAVDLADPDLTVGPLGGTLVEWVLEALDTYVSEPLADRLLGIATDALGTLPLGGPYGVRIDLLGTSLDLDLRSLFADQDGLALGLAAGIGGPSPDRPPDAPFPGLDHAPGSQAALGLHEFLLDRVVSGQVLGTLAQTQELGGALGDLVGTWVETLPGGGDAPEGDGWCLALDPGTLHLVRLQEGLDPLAVLLLPDVTLRLGVLGGSGCDDWLEASLAVEVGIEVHEGTVLRMDPDVVEGAILAYGAPPGWDEAEVVEGIGTLVEGLLVLAGGMPQVDLSDALGPMPLPPGLPPLSPVLTGSTPLGPEGLFAVSLDLFTEDRSVP